VPSILVLRSLLLLIQLSLLLTVVHLLLRLLGLPLLMVPQCWVLAGSSSGGTKSGANSEGAAGTAGTAGAVAVQGTCEVTKFAVETWMPNKALSQVRHTTFPFQKAHVLSNMF